jgi:hypothetical protein
LGGDSVGWVGTSTSIACNSSKQVTSPATVSFTGKYVNIPQSQAVTWTILPASGTLPQSLTPVAYGSSVTFQQTGTSNFWTPTNCPNNNIILGTGNNAVFTLVPQNPADAGSGIPIVQNITSPYNVVVNAVYLESQQSPGYYAASFAGLFGMTSSPVQFFEMFWVPPLLQPPAPPAPAVCTPACTAGQTCVSGQCVAACTSTSQCPAGFVCTSGQCTAATPPGGCSGTQPCPAGSYCNGGKCFANPVVPAPPTSSKKLYYIIGGVAGGVLLLIIIVAILASAGKTKPAAQTLVSK